MPTNGTLPVRVPFVAARDALRQVWSPPLDTFVTEDLPMLLTRLNLVQPVATHTARREDMPGEREGR